MAKVRMQKVEADDQDAQRPGNKQFFLRGCNPSDEERSAGPALNTERSSTGNGKRAESEAGWPRSRMHIEDLKNLEKDVLEARTRRGRAEAQLQHENCEEKPGTPSKGGCVRRTRRLVWVRSARGASST